MSDTLNKKRRRSDSPIRRRRLSDFAAKLLGEWRKLQLPTSRETVVIAVSGGADSTALLLTLDELIRANKMSVTPVVAHLDHRLRKGSKEDAVWVKQLCESLHYKSVGSTANVKKKAKDAGDNLEQAARRARYDFLKKTALQENSHIVLTAHTLDDQAETILMRLLRGSAAEGLSGTESIRPLERNSQIKLVRPLLSWARRSDTEEYCRARRVRFRVDEMNSDERFVRVKVRKQLLPLMQSFNSRVVETLTRTARLLRDDVEALSEQATLLFVAASDPKAATKAPAHVPPLKASILTAAPAAIRRRALREWIAQAQGHVRRLEMVHLLAVEKLLESSRGRIVELPNGIKVTRKSGWLHLSKNRPKRRVEKAPPDV